MNEAINFAVRPDAWLHFTVAAAGTPGRASFHMRSIAHLVSLTAQGGHAVRWITRGRETRWQEAAGAVNVTPFDGGQHAFLTAMQPDFRSDVLLIPDADFAGLVRADGGDERVTLRQVLAHDDAVLRGCVQRLTSFAATDPDPPDGYDEAARRLALRLAELSGGRPPEWQRDTHAFDRRTLGQLVDFIDAHLRFAPRLLDMADRVGLSPSHFARKFRHSTGHSLHRFVNRRRIQASLDALKAQAPLALVACDLGFSSQSHFTRLFSDLTGMTPARYRKQFRPTVG